ncbi:MAG: flagellar hook-length control protein FliK [Alphaproteobacteria bacterium]|nr:flagellar hook-length control protein FliK [Alphaproteobacteria bacterium]
MIAASDSAGKASARGAARAPDKDADNSPFAILLAETAQQPTQKQPAAAAANKTDASQPATAAVESPDTPDDQPNIAPQTASSASADKRDKKDDGINSLADGTDALQAPVPPTLIPVAIIAQVPQADPQVSDPAPPANSQPLDQAQGLVTSGPAAVIPPAPQANSQPPDQTPAPATSVPAAASPSVAPRANPRALHIALAAPGSVSSQAAPADDDISDTDSGASHAAAGPESGNGPVTQMPDAPPAAGNAGEAASPLPSMIAAAAPSRPDDSKLATDETNAAKPESDPPQPAANAASAADALAQTVLAAPSLTPAPGPAASNRPDDTAQAAQIAGIAAPATDKSGTGGAPSAGRQPKPADTARIPAAAPASLPATAASTTVTHGDVVKDSGPAKADSDAKPAHIADAQPQPDMPAPSPQLAPAPPVPHMAANIFGIAPPTATAAGNSMVTSTIQIAQADAGPTPDLDALAVSVAARVMSGAKQFEIRLDPPELGRVDVRLSIDASGKTQAHMTADQPQTLNLLQKDATNLTQALRDAGLDVSQGGLNFSLRGQDRQNDDSNNGGAQGRRTNLIATRAIQAVQSQGAISFNGAAADARVDIHV